MIKSILIISFLWCVASSTASAQSRANTSFYIETYGSADGANSAQIERTENIFRKLKRTIGQSVSSAKLVIVNSDGKPWAIALADGNVILSKGALDIIALAETSDQADAWLAFVLGHELAHLANGDLWHHKVHASLSGSSGSESLNRVRRELELSATSFAEVRERELKADEVGYTYATLSGYDTSTIFAKTGATDDFLAIWADQTHSIIDPEHHSPTDRTDFLRSRLDEFNKQTELFLFGVRLAHFGRYEDALYILEDFSKVFASRQVMSNIGYVLIQLARKRMPPAMAYRFWLPTMLEANSGVPDFPRQWQSELPSDVKDYLERAVDVLQIATKMDDNDLVSRINLVTAYLYLAENFKARAVVEEALRINPNSVQLQGLRALVLLDEDPSIDMWQRVTEILETLSANENASENIVYNHARLLTERGRHGQAIQYWQRLNKKLHDIPEVYGSIVCHELKAIEDCSQNWAASGRAKINWPLPVDLGTDIDSATARRNLQNWTRNQKQIGPLSIDIFQNGKGNAVLAIDHRVELVSLSAAGLPDANSINIQSGEPGVVMPLGTGTVWSFGAEWSALLHGNELKEIWVAR